MNLEEGKNIIILNAMRRKPPKFEVSSEDQ